MNTLEDTWTSLKTDFKKENQKVIKELDVIKSLVLSPTAEAKRAKEIPDKDNYTLTFSDGENEIFVRGTSHQNKIENIEQMKKEFLERFEQNRTDLLLTENGVFVAEGDSIKICENNRLFDKSIDDPEAHSYIIENFKEQVYMTWLAHQHGLPVESWDMSAIEQTHEVLHRNHTPDDVLGCLIAIGIRHLFENKQQGDTSPITTKAVLDIMQNLYFALPKEEIEKQLPIHLNEENFQRVAHKYFGCSIEETPYEVAKQMAASHYNGKTNSVLADMNLVRDQYAIEKIYRAKEKYKHLFAIAGADHVVAWEYALQKMYQKKAA